MKMDEGQNTPQLGIEFKASASLGKRKDLQDYKEEDGILSLSGSVIYQLLLY